MVLENLWRKLMKTANQVTLTWLSPKKTLYPTRIDPIVFELASIVFPSIASNCCTTSVVVLSFLLSDSISINVFLPERCLLQIHHGMPSHRKDCLWSTTIHCFRLTAAGLWGWPSVGLLVLLGLSAPQDSGSSPWWLPGLGWVGSSPGRWLFRSFGPKWTSDTRVRRSHWIMALETQEWCFQWFFLFFFNTKWGHGSSAWTKTSSWTE